MAAAAILNMAIIFKPLGIFVYLFMPFGLGNAAQSFQRLMDKLFRHLPFLVSYLKDHIITSKNIDEHLQHLEQFLRILNDNSLRIYLAKCTHCGHHSDISGPFTLVLAMAGRWTNMCSH
jgi:hypothetical protein